VSPRQNLARPMESILEVATGLFSEAGYSGTTIRDIAKGVGVLPGSLYAHIETKEDLLLGIVEVGIDHFLEAAETIDRDATPSDRMRMLIRAHVEVVAENPQRTLVVFHQWRYLTGANRARILEKRARYEDIFRKIMQDGLTAGEFDSSLDPKIAVLSILGALNWTAEWYRPDGPKSAAVVSDQIATAVLSGVLTR